MLNSQYFSFNGQKYCCSNKITILELLKYFNYKPSLLVLEYNNLVCSQDQWSKTFLKPNDRIEVLTIVGGG
jgi:sulfur carrier protein|tara:strand:- start:9335 stop:9547 length:213 start_codon:yes stop_codon:yes gene_type:complete